MHFKYMDFTATSTNTVTGGSIWLGPDHITGGSFHVEVGGDATGTFKYYASNDPRARPDHAEFANRDGDEITSDLTFTNPAGSGVSEIVSISDMQFEFIWVTYTNSSGEGPVKVYFSGRD